MTFTALITGASSGLGAEMARQFARLGHNLALCARRTERLEELRAEILAAQPGATVRSYALDVTDPEAVSTVFEQAASDFGHLDRVIINAGLGKGAPIGKGNGAANLETLNTNVIGAFAQAEAAMAIFRRQKQGHLVVISSVSSVRGFPGAMTAYAASKAAVASMGEGIAAEIARKPGLDIDVSVICPGYIRSEMNDHVEQKTRFMVETPVGVAAMVDAIEDRKLKAYVPSNPWAAMVPVMRRTPTKYLHRLM